MRLTNLPVLLMLTVAPCAAGADTLKEYFDARDVFLPSTVFGTGTPEEFARTRVMIDGLTGSWAPLGKLDDPTTPIASDQPDALQASFQLVCSKPDKVFRIAKTGQISFDLTGTYRREDGNPADYVEHLRATNGGQFAVWVDEATVEDRALGSHVDDPNRQDTKLTLLASNAPRSISLFHPSQNILILVDPTRADQRAAIYARCTP